MIEDKDQFHGVALSFLLLALSEKKKFMSLILNGESSSEYVLKIKKDKKDMFFKKKQEFLNIGLYVKYSTKRRTPWAYTFNRQHQEDIDKSFKKHATTFVILINSNDGIVCLEYNEFRKILDYNHEEAEGIRVSRRLKQSYRLTGRDGKLNHTIAPSSFPKKITEYIETFYEN